MEKQYDIDTITSHILKAGVLTSLSFILIGIALLFINGQGDHYTLSQIANFNSTFNSRFIPLTGILPGIIALDGVYYVTMGLWILIFTPITVVFTALYSFTLKRNPSYVVMSIIVLFNLFFAMIVVPRLLI
ncbi:MAG: DUF1634 domain-containing protein [Candidatus Thermoplasmatota archaeon]|nr:DUF1634 domain-containing protein [Candidatus Thermoplasmatota archaeon]